MRKILLVSPVSQANLLAKSFYFPPLSLLQLATLTPDNYEVELFDENVEKERVEEKNLDEVDLVAITVMTSQAPRAYWLAKRFKNLGKKVVMGGIHVTALPEEAIRYADAVVIGEAEGVWEKVLEDFAKGKLKKFYQAQKLPDPSEIPIPRRELLKKNSYILANTIQVSRGCPFDCSFCSVSRFFGRTYRFRPVENVVKEIEMIIEADKVHPARDFLSKLFGEKFNRTVIGFMDDNIFGNKQYARILFRSLIPLRIFWGGQASINIAQPENEKLVELAAESGCKLLFVGLESINSQSLKEARKSINKPKEYTRAIKLFHKYGISVLGAFIFGFDSDTPEVFQETLEFAEKVKLEGVQAAILTPLPGTRLWEELEKEGRITERKWEKYDFRSCVFQPKGLSKEELEEGRKWLLRRFYSFNSVLKRFPFFDPRRWIVYGMLNYGYRKQIFRNRS
jgi:radical SAM superfamily enzyme YgiQ (UPF0313 family)